MLSISRYIFVVCENDICQKQLKKNFTFQVQSFNEELFIISDFENQCESTLTNE